MSPPQAQTINLTSLPAAQTVGKISFQAFDFGGRRATKVTVNPGGSWSADLKDHHGTSSCRKSHFGFVLSGTMAIRMDDGQEVTMRPEDLFFVPPGHDAWCVGDEPGVFLEFSEEAA